MAPPSIVSLVQLGFAGFVAAMALLSYLLMVLEGRKPTPRQMVYTNVQRYLRYTIVLSLIVLLGAIADGGKDLLGKWLASLVARDERQTERERRQAVTQTQQAHDCRQALTGLVSEESRSSKNPHEVQRLAHAACFNVMAQIEQLEAQQ